MPHRPPDIELRIRGPAEPQDDADRRLRSALKKLLRGYSYKAISVREVKGEHQDGRKADEAGPRFEDRANPAYAPADHAESQQAASSAIWRAGRM